MKQDTIASIVIRAAAEKAIRDIRVDPSRGAKGLISLAQQFAQEKASKELLSVFGRQMQREGSAYYQLMQRLTLCVDQDALVDFGMNLGYHCWTLGAKTIRKLEAEQGFPIPWCMVFALDQGNLPLSSIDHAIGQGKEMGIYAYFFMVEEKYAGLDPLMQLLRAERDCACILFLHPRAVSKGVADGLSMLKTVLPVIDLATGEPQSIQSATQLLQERRCFHGGFVRSAECNAKAVPAMALADALQIPLAVLINTSRRRRSPLQQPQKSAGELRLAPPYPVLPIDLYADIVLADRNRGTPALCTTVADDGTVVVSTAEGVAFHTPYNIRKTPLHAIFANTMPKQKSMGV